MFIEESEATCSGHTIKGSILCAPLIALFGFLMVFGGIGCKDPDTIGLDILPATDLINGKFSDTTTLIAYTVLADSLRSDEAILTPLGSYIDPVFGYSTASFYVMYSLPTNNVNFGKNFKPNSVEMTFAYSGFYGETPVPQTIMIYRLTESIDASASYYTSTDIAVDLAVNLGGDTLDPSTSDESFTFQLNDSVFTTADSSFTDNAAFQSFLKGFYVVTNMMQPGGIHYLNMDDLAELTKLTLYYNDSMSFDFEIDIESAWFNRFHHNYDGTLIEAQLADPSLGDSLVYVQPNGGVMVKLEMPYITNWVKDQKIAVNKAELVLKVYDDGTVNTYPVPENLFILGAGDDPVISDQFEGATYFGGTYDPVDSTYSFNIARYVHDLLYEGRSNDGMYLIVPNNLLTSGSVVSANRVVLGGPGHSSLGMTLNLIYTEL